MRTVCESRRALSVWIAAALLAGCGGSQPPIGVPGTIAQVPGSTNYKSLYSFGKGSDGQEPKAGLIDVNGTFYGTTYKGGAYSDGTVFSMSLGGKETVLHSFGHGSDGETPLAGLIDAKDTLYGTTSAGGKYGDGTVFALTP